MSVRKYKHLSERERLKIYELLFEGYSLQGIATHIGYHKSTIYRELSRNSTKLGYRPDFASQQYFLRRRYKPCKLEKDKTLKEYVLLKLEEGWSPEQIAGRLNRDYGSVVVSHETIYQYIYSSTGKSLNLYRFLRKKRKFRYPRRKRMRQKSNLDKESIHFRPEFINDRTSFGHWEGDLILFQKTRTNLFTLRERKSRFLIAIKNANRRSKETSKTVVRYMNKNLMMMDSLTLDNDPAFAEYKVMGAELGADIYFCDPYKSYQKGAIENGNRLIREKLPRRAKIDQISQTEIEGILNDLNCRPMKVLGFLTPKEAFLQESFLRSSF